jgi:hypothetical protein
MVDRHDLNRNRLRMPVLFRRFAQWPWPTRIIILIALAIGLAERVGWAVSRRTPWAVGEAPNVAIALAKGRGFADAFFPGQGPTAHVLPIAPAVAGAVYWLFGIRTPIAETILCGWSLLLTFGCYGLFALIFARLGLHRRAVLGGFVLLCVLPVYTTNEAFEFRVWEGGLGLLLGALSLLLFIRADAGEPPRHFAIWRALLPAAAFFVNPPVGVAAVLAAALYWWRHRHTERFWKVALAGLAAIALFVLPWTIRNERAMGHAIPLRDDLGMEIAVANHPAAVHPADLDRVFMDRLIAIQPYIHPPAYRAMWASGGEVAYSQKLGRETAAWMKAHPGDVAIIWRRHFVEMLFTRKWLFKTAHGRSLPLIRTIIVNVVAVLGLIGLALAARRRDGLYAYALIFVAVPTLLYVPFQPINRYTWLIWPPLIYLAVDAITRAWSARRSQSSSSS